MAAIFTVLCAVCKYPVPLVGFLLPACCPHCKHAAFYIHELTEKDQRFLQKGMIKSDEDDEA